ASLVATTQATLSPTYRTLSTASAVSSCPTGRMPYLFGASGPVTTQTTPSSASAREASIFFMVAWGYGECRILPYNIPGRDRSSAYLPCPVVFPAESTSAIRLPMMEKLLIAISTQQSAFSQTDVLRSGDREAALCVPPYPLWFISSPRLRAPW